MLYQAYQVNDDVLAPIRLMAEATRGLLTQPWPFISDNPFVRSISAPLSLTSINVRDCWRVTAIRVSAIRGSSL